MRYLVEFDPEDAVESANGLTVEFDGATVEFAVRAAQVIVSYLAKKLLGCYAGYLR